MDQRLYGCIVKGLMELMEYYLDNVTNSVHPDCRCSKDKPTKQRLLEVNFPYTLYVRPSSVRWSVGRLVDMSVMNS